MPVARNWETTRLTDAFRRQLADAWAVIEPNLDGLTDEEYFWEPVPGCWSVRRRGEATAPLVWGKGEWVVENSWDPPSPPPFTTIAWRLMHGYDCMNDYFGRGLGELHDGLQDWNEIEVPGHAAGAVVLMTDLIHKIDATLASIDDGILDRPAVNDGTDRSASDAVSFAFLEATHHCAEVGVLRDLYRLRSSSNAS